jgi:hypothetical protein
MEGNRAKYINLWQKTGKISLKKKAEMTEFWKRIAEFGHLIAVKR